VALIYWCETSSSIKTSIGLLPYLMENIEILNKAKDRWTNLTETNEWFFLIYFENSFFV